MDVMQVQVEYGPGKIRKFNIPENPCTYSELKADIQCRVPSLVGKIFGLQYLDDEDNWIIASSDACVQEAFRCAKYVEGTSMKRMKIRTFEGCSPQVTTVSTEKKSVMKPKCLFTEDENQSKDESSEPSKSVDTATREKKNTDHQYSC